MNFNKTKTISFLLIIVLGTTLVVFSTNTTVANTATSTYVDPLLQDKMSSATDFDTFEVIITHDGSLTSSQLDSLGVEYRQLTNLPMFGAILTLDQINSVASLEQVQTLYYNQQLQYLNYEASEITGTHTVQSTSGYTGEGITIAVVDSGINALHPDLEYGSKVIQNVKVLTSLGTTDPVYQEDVVNTDTSSGHGTHVAGIVGGTGQMSQDPEDNPQAFGSWLDGAAPDASLVGLGAGEGLSILAALDSFDYILSNYNEYDISVVTNSWGTSSGNFDPNNPINIATYELYSKGMTVLFAAGNDGPGEDTLNPYSLAPWVISVGAGNDNKQLTDFSSRGVQNDELKHPDIVAPGSLIVSTKSQNTALAALGNDWNLDDHEYNDHYAEYVTWYHAMSGTSMATPFVAGIVALVQEANPTLSPDQIIDIISTSGDQMFDANGEPYETWEVGGGYINSITATDKAINTAGNLEDFLSGDVAYSSQGEWQVVDNTDLDYLNYIGGWKEKRNGQYDNELLVGNSIHYNPGFALDSISFDFVGSSFKLSTISHEKGGVARILVDNTIIDTIDTYSPEMKYNQNYSYTGFEPDQVHNVKLEVLGQHSSESKGDVILFDAAYVDGFVLKANSEIITSTLHYEGTIGPSVGEVGQITEEHYYNLDLGQAVILVNIELSWDTVADLDLYLLDSSGNVVASGATLANPELIKLLAPASGTYEVMVRGYASVLTTYSLDITISSSI